VVNFARFEECDLIEKPAMDMMPIPRQDLSFRKQDSGFELLLKRNCSISPSGLLTAYLVISVITLFIAAGFAAVGAWMVVPFAGLELVLLGVAFTICARHATDYERIALNAGCLTVEVCESDEVRRHEFNPAWARVMLNRDGFGSRVVLKSSGRSLEIGRHLHVQARRELADALGERLRKSG